MKKFALFMLILTLIIVGVSFLLDRCNQNEEPPQSVDARYVVQTGASEGHEYYYTDSYEETTSRIYGDAIVLHGYWEYDKGKWVYRVGDLQLAYRAYPRLIIRAR